LSEVGDIEIFPHGDELHLFHLTLPNHDVVQHVVSTDGLSWRTLPNALRTGEPGDCDDDQIWTMSVSQHGGAFRMLYTALDRAGDGMVQRTALATSSDLITWSKSSRNPVAEADPHWYEVDPSTSGSVSWRDPKPIKVGDTWYAVVNARTRGGPIMRRGCVGLLTSTDFERWEVRPPLFAPGRFWDLECPQVFTIDGAFYLTAAVMEDRSQRYWMAPSIEGPWTIPPDGGRLAPDGHYAGRVASWHGQDIYMCWHLPPTKQADWITARNPHGKFIPAPLTLMQRPDGSLARGSFDGWSGYETTAPAPVAPQSTTLFRGAEMTGTDGEWSLHTNPGELDLLASSDAQTDFSLTGTLILDAPAGGIAFRLDGDTGGGMFVELAAGSDAVVVQRWVLTRNSRSDRQWFAVDTLQRGRLPRPLTPGTPLELGLIVNGPYIELSLGGEVVIATLSEATSTGRIGIWADSGAISLTDARLAPLRRPVHG
jgi:beta-fructofuranosidase